MFENERSTVSQRLKASSLQKSTIDEQVRTDLMLYPKSGNLISLAGKIVEREQGLDAALPWYRNARETSPVRHYSTLVMATTHQKAGLIEDAALAYRDLCLMAPDDWNLQFGWARSLLKLPNGRAVMNALSKISSECPTAPISELHYAGKITAMYEMAEIALKYHPDSPRLRFYRGRAALSLGNLNQANLDSALLLGQHPDRPEGMILEGMIQMKTDPRTSMMLFEQALGKSFHWSVPIRTYSRDAWEEAVKLWAEMAIEVTDEKAFRRATTILRNRYARRAEIRALRARFAMKTNQFEEAVREFSLIRRTTLSNPDLKFQYLQALAATYRESLMQPLCKPEEQWPSNYLARVQRICKGPSE